MKDPVNDFLLPIIFAMDKTTISSTSDLHVYAIMFTTSIFNLHTRNKATAWKPLGYIPNDRQYYSSVQWDSMTSEEKSTRLNYLFDTVLQSFRAAQEDNALTIPLTLAMIQSLLN